jgi:hypothetical protein
MDLDNAPGGILFLLDAVVLNLKIEVLAKELIKLFRPGLGALIVAPENTLGNLAGNTAGQAYKPLGVLVQQLPVDTGSDIETLGKAGRDQIAEIPVAHLILAQQDKVGIIIVYAMLAVAHITGGNVHLTADNRLDTGLLAGLVKGNCAVHYAMVCDGDGGLAQFLGALSKPVGAAGAVQQAEFSMHM